MAERTYIFKCDLELKLLLYFTMVMEKPFWGLVSYTNSRHNATQIVTPSLDGLPTRAKKKNCF